MKRFEGSFRLVMPGILAGVVNGIFGTGGGMVLVPLLARFGWLRRHQVFAAALAIMLPISGAALLGSVSRGSALPGGSAAVCISGVLGGLLSSALFQKIPVGWLHRCMGLLLILGAVYRVIRC